MSSTPAEAGARCAEERAGAVTCPAATAKSATNDLDINTLRALEEALENFAGCAIVVSHDRWFLDRICTHILAFEDDSQTRWFMGNWSDYEAYMQEQYGKDLTPHRIKYRTLKR